MGKETKTPRSHDIFGDGKCCCNCGNQVELFKHPGNTQKQFKGYASESTGLYACICRFDEPEKVPHPHGIVFEDKHSVCEMWQPRKEEL